MATDVLIVGGGVIGSAVAFYAAREGVRVTLLERDAVASHASGVAAGVLTPIGGRERGPGLGPFARRSADQFPGLVEELRACSGIDPEYERPGLLSVALSDVEAASLRESDAHRSGDAEWIDGPAVRTAHPLVSPEVRGALWSADEANVRSALLTRAFARAAVQLGAVVESGISVRRVRVERGRATGVETAAGFRAAGCVVVCAGPWTPPLAGTRAYPGETFRIVPTRGQILSLDAPATPLRPMLEGAGVYLVPKRDGSVVVGATEEDAGFDRRVTAAGVRWLLERAERAVPALSHCTFRGASAGLRPRTPDGLPMIGPVPGCEGLALASGHHRCGILLSPVTGQLIAGWITGKGIPDEAALFLPQRFVA